MELYLHYAESSDDCACEPPCPRCQSRRHLLPLHSCAYPRVDGNSSSPYTDHEKRRGTMFFSQQKLQKHFGKLEMINDLLLCQCHQCKQARAKTSTLDEQERPGIIRTSKHGQLLFALMVYLRKFHFVYVWFASGHREEELGSALFELHREQAFDDFMENETERRLFKDASDDAWKMFNPVKLVFPTTPRKYHKSDRFPFLAEEEIIGGNFGTLTKFKIVPEYYEDVEHRMLEYSSSAVGHGSTRRLLFAKKSVKISDERDEGLHALALAEQDMLRMVSRLDTPATDNIVTLLTCYNWGDAMHFVFPYIETDLKRLLDGDLDNPDIMASLFHNSQEIPENRLWKEMVGVTQALKAIHTEMKNPFEDGQREERVLACHFDLKPANILITGDGKLKIGDFGHSHIQIVRTGETAEVNYRGGDPMYAAPESQLPIEQTQEVIQLGEDGNAPAIKYDVWSLACIMVEVLIRLLSSEGSQLPLKQFREKLAEFQRGGLYKHQFFNEHGVKNCVRAAIAGLRGEDSAESAINQYMSTIRSLLLDMFQKDNNSRPSSQDVLSRLQEARANYRERVAPNDLALRLKRESLMQDRTFAEIGWTNPSGQLVSFIEMNDINLAAMPQSGQNPLWGGPCNIQLFQRASRESQRTTRENQRPSREDPRLSHDRGPTFNLHCAVKVNENRVKIHKTSISFPAWVFKPTYLFQTPSTPEKFDCLLFPVEDNPLHPPLVLTFASLQALHAFQGALLQKRVFTLYEFYGATIELVRYDPRRSETLDSASVQFWTSDSPKYLANAGTYRQSSEETSETMVVFSPKTPNTTALLQIPLNNRQKKFIEVGRPPKIQILPRDTYRHFKTFESPSRNPWEPDHGEGTTSRLKTPAVRLESGKELKVKGMTVSMPERLGEDWCDKLYNATGGGGWKNV